MIAPRPGSARESTLTITGSSTSSRILVVCLFALVGCSREAPRSVVSPGDGSAQLKPLGDIKSDALQRRQRYVPVYSSIYWGSKRRTAELTAMVSIRNVSSKHPIVLEFARYHDSAGRKVREYVHAPARLDPLAGVEFVIDQQDTVGGTAASFLIEWAGPPDIDEPLIEAVMVGQVGSVGISFTSASRELKQP